MTTIDNLVSGAMADGVALTLNLDGTLDVVGERSVLARWLPAIRAHKDEIKAMLSARTCAPTVRCAGCAHFRRHPGHPVLGSCRVDVPALGSSGLHWGTSEHLCSQFSTIREVTK